MRESEIRKSVEKKERLKKYLPFFLIGATANVQPKNDLCVDTF